MCRLHVGRKRRGKREKQVNAAAGPTQRGRESGARFTLLLSFLASSPRLFSWIVAQERYSMYQFKNPMRSEGGSAKLARAQQVISPIQQFLLVIHGLNTVQ